MFFFSFSIVGKAKNQSINATNCNIFAPSSPFCYRLKSVAVASSVLRKIWTIHLRRRALLYIVGGRSIFRRTAYEFLPVHWTLADPMLRCRLLLPPNGSKHCARLICTLFDAGQRNRRIPSIHPVLLKWIKQRNVKKSHLWSFSINLYVVWVRVFVQFTDQR